MSTYLPGVVANAKPGPYHDMIAGAAASGAPHPKIWDLFAFQNDVTLHLGRFTHGVIRQPASISVGFRELIAAYTSFLNECEFCTHAHAAAAAELLGGAAVVWGVLRDP
jgi:AhpD family alkylhydroperoxidase